MDRFSKKELKIYTNICTKTDKELKSTLLDIIKEAGYVNIINRNGYLMAEGDSPVMLIAHCDTVFSTPPHESDIFYDRDKNVIWSVGGGIGDDRAGVYAILKILQTGLRPHILFTLGEEMGGIGATELVKDFPQCPFDIKYLIQMDREGLGEAVFYDCDNKDFIDYVENFGFVEHYGVFSDISIIAPEWRVAATNLSVGYYNQHSYREILFVPSLFKTIERTKAMIIDSFNISKFEYVDKEFDYSFNLLNEEENNCCWACGKSLKDVDKMDKNVIYHDSGSITICQECFADHFFPTEDLTLCNKCGSYLFKDSSFDDDNEICYRCKHKKGNN